MLPLSSSDMIWKGIVQRYGLEKNGSSFVDEIQIQFNTIVIDERWFASLFTTGKERGEGP
jgi:hypothetical protein